MTQTCEFTDPKARLEGAATCPLFPVLIFYEDHFAGIRAMEIYHHLARHVGADLKMTCDLWRFDVLRIPALQQTVGRQMAQARLLLFSAHEGFQLAPEFKLWFELLLSKRSDADCALAALMGRPGPRRKQTDSLRCYLRQLAHNLGMMFSAATYVGRTPQVSSPVVEAPSAMLWRNRFGCRRPA